MIPMNNQVPHQKLQNAQSSTEQSSGAGQGITPTQREYIRQNGKIIKIMIDRNLCIGAASCVAIGGASFAIDEENKAIVLDADALDDEALLLAAQSCPTKAIFIYDAEGRQIYP